MQCLNIDLLIAFLHNFRQLETDYQIVIDMSRAQTKAL